MDGVSELSPKRAKMLLLFDGCFPSSLSPTSSNPSSSSVVGSGRENESDLTAERDGRDIVESRLCRAADDSCG